MIGPPDRIAITFGVEFVPIDDVRTEIVCFQRVFIERFFRSLKYNHVYLYPAGDGLELYKGIKEYIDYYNNTKCHQGIGRQIPATLYRQAA